MRRLIPSTAALLAGCTAGTAPRMLAAPTLTLDADHPNVVHASAPAEDACELAWTTPRGEATGGEAEDGELRATIAGLAPDADVTATLRCGTSSSAAATIRVPALPEDVPTLTVDTAARGISEPFFLHEWFRLGPEGFLTIEDLDGNVVWWLSQGTHTSTHAHYDPEAQVVYAVEQDDAHQSYLLVAPIAGPARRWPVANAHHDSVALGDGRYLVPVTVEREVDGQTVAGDELVRIDDADGSTEVVWSAFDALEVIPNDGWSARLPDGAADWTHVNGLDWDPDAGRVYVSMYWERAIVVIDPADWTVEHVVGGSQSDYTVPEPFGPQHSPVHAGNTLWMFDNGSSAAEGSRLAAYTLDDAAMTATRTYSWQPDPVTFDVVLGSVDPHDDAIIGSWGDLGTIRILSPAGEVLGSYDLGGNDQVGYTSLLESLP